MEWQKNLWISAGLPLFDEQKAEVHLITATHSRRYLV